MIYFPPLNLLEKTTNKYAAKQSKPKLKTSELYLSNEHSIPNFTDTDNWGADNW